jgi:hypothetical protein
MDVGSGKSGPGVWLEIAENFPSLYSNTNKSRLMISLITHDLKTSLLLITSSTPFQAFLPSLLIGLNSHIRREFGTQGFVEALKAARLTRKVSGIKTALIHEPRQ